MINNQRLKIIIITIIFVFTLCLIYINIPTTIGNINGLTFKLVTTQKKILLDESKLLFLKIMVVTFTTVSVKRALMVFFLLLFMICIKGIIVNMEELC